MNITVRMIPTPDLQELALGTLRLISFGPLLKSRGAYDLTCGRCGTVLVAGSARNQLTGILIQCFVCHASNLAPQM